MRQNASIDRQAVLAAIARRLATVRTSLGFNQTEFADRLGFPKRTYLGWERGETEAPIWLLAALQCEFDIDPGWILQGPGDEPRPYAAQVDLARLREISKQVGAIASKLGLELGFDDVLELAETIFIEPQPMQERLLTALEVKIRVMLRSRT